MSIKEQLDQYTTYVSQAETDLTNIKSALTGLEVTVPETTKLSNIPTLIGQIKTGSSVELVITAPDYEGQTLTATKGSKKITGKVTSNVARIPVDEEGTWTVSASDENSIDIETDLTFEGYLNTQKIYGIRIKESESDPAKRIIYTDDAATMNPVTVTAETGKANYNNWDKTWIFQKIYPCMVKTDGTIAYKLNPNDYGKKSTGENSDVSNINFDGNAMVCIEKFYTKFSMDGTDELIQITNKKTSGYEAIGFIRSDGSEADRIFLPMFMGSFDINSKLRSLSDQTIKYSTSFNDFRTAAQKNGENYDIETWAMNQIIQAVYFILMKNCNPQAAIGAGRNYNDGGSKTGLANTLGPISCDPTTKSVKFMHIEDFTSSYSNGMWRWEAGLLCQSSKIYVKMRPPYSGTATSGYSQISDVTTKTGYLSQMKCSNTYGRYGLACGGSSATYEVAQWYTNSGSSIYVSRRGNNFGVAGRSIANSASDTIINIGAALSLLPPA